MALITLNFFSQALNRTVPCNVVIPSDKVVARGAEAAPRGPYKTLYLLHGILGNYTDWVAGTRVQALANAHDLCVVMPSGDNKFYCDSALSGDYYARFIGQELVEFTHATFNLSTRREDTYIAGLSMGGFGALVNGLRNMDTFSHIAAFSAALIKDRILGAVQEPGHDFFTRAQYCTLFGLQKVADFEGCPWDYDALARAAGPQRDKPRIYMACGTEDGLIAANTAYRDLLEAQGFTVTWRQERGGHDWNFWDRAIEWVMDWLPLGEAVRGISSENVK